MLTGARKKFFLKPILSCSLILLGCSQKFSCTLESVQNRSIQIIFLVPKRLSVTAGRLMLNLPTLISRHSYLFHKFVKRKLLKSKASNRLTQILQSLSTHTPSLRTKYQIIKLCFRTNFGKCCLIGLICSLLSIHKQRRKLLSFQL